MKQKTTTDTSSDSLKLLEEAEREFQNHWVWKELQCTPDQFFKTVESHVASLEIPSEVWKQTYEKARAASRIRTMEKRNIMRPIHLELMRAIRV